MVRRVTIDDCIPDILIIDRMQKTRRKQQEYDIKRKTRHRPKIKLPRKTGQQ